MMMYVLLGSKQTEQTYLSFGAVRPSMSAVGRNPDRSDLWSFRVAFRWYRWARMMMMMMNKSVGTQVGRRRREKKKKKKSGVIRLRSKLFSGWEGEGGSIRQHSTIKPTNKGTAAGAALRFVRLNPQHVTSGMRERNDILYARKRGKRVLIRDCL